MAIVSLLIAAGLKCMILLLVEITTEASVALLLILLIIIMHTLTEGDKEG